MTDHTRRGLVLTGVGLAVAGSVPVGAPAFAQTAIDPSRVAGGVPRPRWAVGIEGQRRADLGDGSYLNPVLGGDRPDPNVLKDGDDYYAVFSTFDYYPGAVIWHSRDLVNWTPLGPALITPIGSVLALDLTKHDGRYFVYIPAVDPSLFRPDQPDQLPMRIWVVQASRIEGPWSEPVDMGVIGRIDPGHVVGEDGRRWLFLDDGHRVAISADGLRRAGEIEKVYDGWRYPTDWVDEGFGLEGPKLIRREGWFYLFSAQGGTAGPPTSHMVVVARARSIDGPWENCPANPIVRTRDRAEPWWSRGHATPVEGPDGRWWLVYHGYENGLRTLGRQMLLEPMIWGADGWPRATGGDLLAPLAKPGRTAAAPSGQALSGPFRPADLGRRLVFYKPTRGYRDRARFEGGALTLTGLGKGPADSSPLALIPPDRSYEVSVDVELGAGAQGGLLLFYNDKLFTGLGFNNGRMVAYKNGAPELAPVAGAPAVSRIRIKVVNDEDVASFYWSMDGRDWTRARSFDVSGLNHNMGGGFLSLRPALFAAGAGTATFRELRYRARPPLT